MTSFSSLTPEKIGLWCGMVLAGGALVIGGSKALEHGSFQAAQAQVTGTEIRCEMTSSGGRQRVTQLVMCGDVATVKAQNPDVEWRVSAEPFVTLAFATATGERISTKVELSTLNRATTAIGDSVGILYRPDRPTRVSAQATPTFFVMNGMALAGGLMLCAVAGMLQRRRDMAGTSASAVATLYAANAASQLPTMDSPPMWAEPAQAAVKPQVA
jgi:hypothetical protein